MFLQKRNFDRPHPFLKLFSTSFFWPLTFTIPITSLPWCLLLVCESTWKVFSSDERRCACSCRFSLMILSSRLLFWNSKVFEGIGPPTKGGERRLSTFFSWLFHQKRPSARLPPRALVLFYFENPQCATSSWCLQFVHVCLVFTVCISMFDTIENDMTCDAFNVSDVKSCK